MDKVIEEFFRVFKVLARELQIYFFSGVMVASNILFIDNIYFKSSILYFAQVNKLIVPAIVVIYLLGHFCMAFYHLLMVRGKIEYIIGKYMDKDLELERATLPKIHKKNAEIYIHFIDRSEIQILTRCTFCSACIINLIINLTLVVTRSCDWRVLLSIVIFFIGGIAFYLLACGIETEAQKQLSCINTDV